MSEWAAKRFWTSVEVVPGTDGFGVQLDGRPVKTPAKAKLIVPTRAVATAIAAEWDAVDGAINPEVMPLTRSANAALDKVSHQFDEVAEMLAAYADSDLTCYRADAPEGLVAKQAQAWDPLLDWADDRYGARLLSTAGLMPISQPKKALERVTAPLFDASPFELTAMHDLIALSGSLVIGLAVTEGRLTPDEAWMLSRVDEAWQADQWGYDEEAVQAAEIKRTAFLHAASFYTALQSGQNA